MGLRRQNKNYVHIFNKIFKDLFNGNPFFFSSILFNARAVVSIFFYYFSKYLTSTLIKASGILSQL